MSYAYQESQKQAIIGQITALMKDLQQLAPHPDKPDHNGPLFINSNPNFKVANDHDGMLGTIIMESLLGSAISEAVSETLGNWTQEFDASNALECYSEYITDIEKSTQKAAAHGQGTMARMAGKSISNSFNIRSTISEGLQAFYNDMPKRMNIETQLSKCVKQLNDLDQKTPTYDVAKPRFAA
ncbi:MAG: hypothetical protein ACRBDI_03270 [Alphaproteobacteria bacterium]